MGKEFFFQDDLFFGLKSWKLTVFSRVFLGFRAYSNVHSTGLSNVQFIVLPLFECCNNFPTSGLTSLILMSINNLLM